LPKGEKMTQTEKTQNKSVEPIVVTVKEKKCGKCHVVKPASDFWKMRSSKDGLQPQCKPCQLGIAPTEKPAGTTSAPKKEKKTSTSAGITSDLAGNKLKNEAAAHKAKNDTTEKAPRKSRAQPIGSGRRKECGSCVYQIKSTEGGRCISEAAEKDTEKDAKGTCKHHVQSKTAKKAAKKAKKAAKNA
jgi:hypothetical protein